MKHTQWENAIKNIIVAILLVFSYSVVQSSFDNIATSIDKSTLGSLLTAVGIMSVIACFGNFAFTYEKVKLSNIKFRLLAHVTTGLLMFLIGISLEMTAVITQLLIRSIPVFDLSLLILYIASVLYDFWDFNRADL